MGSQGLLVLIGLKILIMMTSLQNIVISHIKILSNAFIKFEKGFFCHYMRVKYIKITNNTFYDDFIPLDNEMELKGLCFQQEKMKLPLFP